ncbi:MAG: hypothetical protein ACREN7_09300, partial [Candidatus Dormibacteria bacterium]
SDSGSARGTVYTATSTASISGTGAPDLLDGRAQGPGSPGPEPVVALAKADGGRPPHSFSGQGEHHRQAHADRP